MEAIDERTLRLLVIGVGAIVLVASLVAAISQLQLLRDVRVSIFDHEPIPGRKPRSAKALERRKNRIDAFRKRIRARLSLHFALLVVSGFVVPSTLLYYGALHYFWFDKGHNALLSVADATPVTQPTEWQTLVFVIAQLTKGAVMDLLEVFHLEVGALTNDPKNYVFSTAIFLYRAFTGAFAAVAFVFLYHVGMIALALRFKARHELIAAVPG